MADDTTKVIRIVVDSSRAVSGGRDAQRALEQIEKSTGSMAQAMDRAMGSLRQLAGLFGVGFSAKSVVDAADAFTKFNNSLLVAGTSAADLAEVQNRLFAAANRNGVEIGALSTLYSRASIAGNELGATQDKLLKFVDGVTAALRVQGGSTQEASGALLQLSQAMGSGIVRAEEFNSILEGAFPVAQAASRGIDGMNGSVSKLRTAVAAGQITSQQFFEGLLKGFTETEKQAAAMNLTVGSSLTVLQNGFIRLVGEVDKASGATGGLARQIAGLGQTLDELSRNKRELYEFVDVWAAKFESTRHEIEQLAELFRRIQGWTADADRNFSTWSANTGDTIRGVFNEAAVTVARWNATLIESLKGLPGLFGGIFTAAMNAALEAVESGINRIIFELNKFGAENPRIWSRLGGGTSDISPVNMGRLTGGTSFDQYRTNIRSAGDAAAAQLREAQNAEADAIEAKRAADAIRNSQAQADREESAARRVPLSVTEPAAKRLTPQPATATGKQSGQEQTYDKLIEKLRAAADAQDEMTKAAIRGDVAYQDQQVHLQAVEKSIEIFGKRLDDTDPRLRKIEELMRQATFGKLAETFAKATNELQNQNEVLEAQIRLMNEAPEIQAREIALIKVKQEVEKAGGTIIQAEIDRRAQAIQQNETLKVQQEQIRQAQELWTEPLKQALRDIQSQTADMYEQMLESGRFTFSSLGEIFTKTLRRMAAEFMALATIRPVMQLFVETIGPSGIGLIGGSTAAQLGFPQSVSTGGGTSGGMGLGSIFSSGGSGGGLGSIFSSSGSSGGGWFSGIGNWLSSPIMPNAGPAITSGSPAMSLAGQYGASSVGLGGLTWGQGLAGVGSIGMGAYQLLSGNGSTSSMIGGGAGILGGAVSLLGPMLGLGAAAGPIGLGIGLVGSLLGGLLGGDKPKIPPQPALNYGMGTFWSNGQGGYLTGGGALGSGSGMESGAQSMANDLMKAFRSAGLSVVPGNLYGGELASGVDHVLQGGQWQNRDYTQTALTLPGGGIERLTYNDSSMNTDQAAEYLLAQVFRANVLRGGVSGAGEGLKAGLEKINPTTTDALNSVIQLGTAYDKLGKTANPLKDSIDQLSASFDDLKDFATQAGLSLDPINEELKKQSTRSAQDFIDAMLDPLAVQMRALEDERQSALESARYIRDNMEGVYVDMDKIATFYTNKEAALRDQFYQGGITNLQTLINRLTLGDLSNASPELQFRGARNQFEDAYQKALGGDATAITNLASYGDAYATAGRQYYASSPEYESLRQEIIKMSADFVAIQQTGGSTTSAEQATQAANEVIASNTALQNVVTAQQQQIAQLTQGMAQLTAQIQRIAVNQR